MEATYASQDRTDQNVQAREMREMKKACDIDTLRKERGRKVLIMRWFTKNLQTVFEGLEMSINK